MMVFTWVHPSSLSGWDYIFYAAISVVAAIIVLVAAWAAKEAWRWRP